MMPDLAGYMALTIIGLAASALFSGMETGLYTINRVRLAVRADRGQRAAQRIRSLLDRPNRMLATLLIGNNMANYAGSFGVAAILNSLGVSPVNAILINVGILVPMLFVFGETLPKDLFRTHTDSWSYRTASLLTWCDRILMWTGLSPLVQGVGAVSAKLVGAPTALPMGARQRISQLIKEGIAAGVLSEAQTTLADRAMTLRDLRVAAVMVPWRAVTRISHDADSASRVRVIEQRNYSRLPVVDRTGRPVGVISTLEALLEVDKPIGQLMQPVIEVEPSLPVREALRRMRAAGTGLAVVSSSKAAAAKNVPQLGIVTFKDLIEPLTGELRAW